MSNEIASLMIFFSFSLHLKSWLNIPWINLDNSVLFFKSNQNVRNSMNIYLLIAKRQVND